MSPDDRLETTPVSSAAAADRPPYPFELNQVSPLVQPDTAVAFWEEHGVFYREDATVGRLVDEIYREKRAEQLLPADYENFREALVKDPCINRIFELYPVILFSVAWGKLDYHFRWTDGDWIDQGKEGKTINIYMQRSNSTCFFIPGSHTFAYSSKPNDSLVLPIPDSAIEQFAEQKITMEQGGMIIFHPYLIHKRTTSEAIMITTRMPKPDDNPRNTS
uniref:Uncharacterized protein n=1 Tax=Bionectria ochroleuca TaxID=29856 RepID=A0A8H7K602_BIOOC